LVLRWTPGPTRRYALIEQYRNSRRLKGALTMDLYSHAIPSMEAEPAETIANLVRSTGK
jgi:hypothetical protein